MKKYSTQKVIELLENKGFSIEDPYGNGTYHCRKPGYREIKFRCHQDGQFFKVLTRYTKSFDRALEMAKLENVA